MAYSPFFLSIFILTSANKKSEICVNDYINKLG